MRTLSAKTSRNTAFRSIGISLPYPFPGGVPRLSGLAACLGDLAAAGPDFVEVFPDQLGAILGGRLDETRLRPVRETLFEASAATGLQYTVHAPLEVNLMDLASSKIQGDVLEASIRFAGGIGADVVVCHAGQRLAVRDSRHSLKDQLAAERAALRAAGDLAGELGVAIAVENFYPDLPVIKGAVYDYSVWPDELAEQVAAVDHDAVGICLDLGHAALASCALGFDYVEECASVAPLVRHVHLHDNLMRPNLTGEPPVSEHPVYGLGDLHLPPGSGTIPLVDALRHADFTQNPSCCVELRPDLHPVAPEAVCSARSLAELALRERISA